MEKKINNVGFCVFGHAFGHQCVSNGLISDLKLEDQTYIKLPKGVFLNKENKPISIISREILSNGLEIIKIFIVNFAESLTVKRDGETVGCAIVFSGNPSSLLLNKALKKTFQESQKLIDNNCTFKTEDINKVNIDLINPTTDGLIEGELLIRSKNREIAGAFGVLSDGNIINQIMPIVQAFIYNPNFKNIEKLYVSEEITFLKKIFEDKKILTSRHILDYSKFHKSHLEKLSNQQKQIKLNDEKLTRFENEFKINKLSREKTLNELLEGQNQYKSRISQLKDEGQEINAKLSQYKNLLNEKQKQTHEISNEINQKKIELAKISQLKFNKFQELLDHNSFQEERNSYEQKFLVKQEQLNEKLAKLENQTMFTKRLAIVFGVLALLIFIGGGILGYSINNTANNDGVLVETIIDQEPKETKIIAEKTIIKAPQEHKVADFLTLSLEKQNSHKAELDKFIEEIQQAGTSKVNISNFLNRNWNFAEVIDYNKDIIDHGLARLKKIKLILEQNGKPISYFTEEFMIDSKEKFNSREFDFRTASRNKILELYLQKPGNMYEGMNIQTEGVTDFEKDLPLLYMHFRWVLFNLSNYKNSDGKSTDADILKTNETKHNIPLNN